MVPNTRSNVRNTNATVMTGNAVTMMNWVTKLIHVKMGMRKKGEVAGKNPWGAATLEWAISSPPPVYNFSVQPEVKSLVPLWVKDGVNEIPDVPPEPVHVPGGSYWPLLTAVGILVFFLAPLLRSIWPALIGVPMIAICIYMWAFEPFEV